MRFWLISVFGVAAMFAACSTVSAVDDEGPLALSSSSKKGNSSNSKNGEKSSSSRSSDDVDKDCEGKTGEPWDGTTAKNFACGSGTKLSPYIILTAEQLAHLSFVVNSSDKAFSGKYFKLGADILLNKGKIIDEKGGFVADSAKLHKWTPIGNSSVAFDGNFDGDGYTVSGMFINPTSKAPFGMRPPSWSYFFGSFKNSTSSCKSCLASSHPATSLNVVFFWAFNCFTWLLPNENGLFPPPPI